MTKHDPTKPPAMDWEAIKAEIHRRGMTLGELSMRAGLHSSACGRVRGTRHYGVQAAMARFLRMKPEDLWPSRYPKGGPRLLDTNKYPPLDSR